MSIAGDVLERHRSGEPGDEPAAAVESDRPERAPFCVPDFVSVGRPRDPGRPSETAQERRPAPGEVDELQRVPVRSLLDECDPVAAGRDARQIEPAGSGLIEHLPDRKFEPLPSLQPLIHCRRGAAGRSRVFDSGHGESAPVRGPVGREDVLGHVARRASGKGDAGQGARRHPLQVHAAGQHRQLPRGGDGRDGALGHVERTRFRAFHARGEHPAGFPFPRGAVDDRVAVRGEARGVDDAAPERELLERRGRRRGPVLEDPVVTDPQRAGDDDRGSRPEYASSFSSPLHGRPQQEPQMRPPRRPPGRSRCPAPTGSAPRVASRGSASPRARARQERPDSPAPAGLP